MFNPRRFPFQSLSPKNYGGDCVVMLAAGTLLVGDVVFYSSANTVNKSSTAADYVAVVGVVVGGTATGMQITADSPAVVGTNAATVGQNVIVQINGIATVIAAAAITIGTRLQVVTTAGRVDDAAFVAGQTVGIALEAATNPADEIAMLIQPK